MGYLDCSQSPIFRGIFETRTLRLNCRHLGLNERTQPGESVVPRCKLSMGQRAFYFRGPREWNGLADNIKNTKEIGSFKRTLFKNMFLNIF